jgi:hypothetical protein
VLDNRTINELAIWLVNKHVIELVEQTVCDLVLELVSQYICIQSVIRFALDEGSSLSDLGCVWLRCDWIFCVLSAFCSWPHMQCQASEVQTLSYEVSCFIMY